ncbi:sulfide:quinone oxidoreductase, mitochondrial [Coccinella septempunctata]|uniref:sulfide:quinone oxidoreductase, mitochondrial n=1 Tax=Coccinella septempunctata TaxID=41139 RepID=UPI001D071AA2|nr:sulfide:quinone oxidoreductase, mitochondrial [Coccinella septempunctata]
MLLSINNSLRNLSWKSSRSLHYGCKVLVVGGGTGGCAVAAKLSKVLGKDEVHILDPSERHYYQPLFTLIGGGVYSLKDSYKLQKDVLPDNAKWIKDRAVEFNPKQNHVLTAMGHKIEYDYMLLALGLETNYEKIPGLLEGLKNWNGICSNYSEKYVEKTFQVLKNFEYGNAIFTYPNSPVKCPGAPQKILYLVDDYLRKNGIRHKAKLIYNTSLPVIFGVKKYADALWKVVNGRDIEVNLRTNLVEVKPDRNEAIFENLDKPGEMQTLTYSMLHVTPPMSTPSALRNNKELSNQAGFADVDPGTLRHTTFSNVFAIGDCSSSPNSKTAAAAAAQSAVVFHNLKAVMDGKEVKRIYDGYASCPLVTGYSKCILAEFNYNLEPLETFPISQDRELTSMYLMKKYLMPSLYWNLMVCGYWNGPATMRKLLHLSMK